MNEIEFSFAKLLESEGWEFTGTNDSDEMCFVRQHNGILFSIEVREDQ